MRPRERSFVFSWRRALADSDLTSNQKLVGLTLSLYMNGDGDAARPAVRTLSKKTGLPPTTVHRLLTSLVARHWLERGDRGNGRPRGYRAALPVDNLAPVGRDTPGRRGTEGEREEGGFPIEETLSTSLLPSRRGRQRGLTGDEIRAMYAEPGPP